MFVLGLVTAFSLLPLVYADGYSCKPLEQGSKGVLFATLERHLEGGDNITIYATATSDIKKRRIYLLPGENRETNNTYYSLEIGSNSLDNQNYTYYSSKCRHGSESAGYRGTYSGHFVEGKKFKLAIKVRQDGYYIFRDDKLLWTLNNREPFYDSVKSIAVVGFKLDSPTKTCEKAKDLKVNENDMDIVISSGVVETRTRYRK
ncbi:unnamed protein product [Caenorhabditis auriculariae]|uniref:Galectin n=1 Tax=Caenorhabditis auriculariae TaxID=2777116 RepID=A0A8S1GUD1_9PELO|nr:unnamed protein product [Caenorhabditis auriculariae]